MLTYVQSIMGATDSFQRFGLNCGLECGLDSALESGPGLGLLRMSGPLLYIGELSQPLICIKPEHRVWP